MKATKYPGVQQHDARDGTCTYYIRYKDLSGKLIRQKIGTRDEGITPLYCKKLRDKTLVKLRLGEDAPVQTRSRVKTLKEVSDEYFDDSEARSKAKLKSVYDAHLSFLDNEPVTTINSEMIDKLKKSKSKEISSKTKRILSKTTVNNILLMLSAILRYAKKKKYIASTPEIEKYRISNSRERFLSVSEINTLYASIENSESPITDQLLLFVKMSLSTGGRLGSILGIKGKNINSINKTVTLQNYKADKTYTAFIPTFLMYEIPDLKPQEKLIDIDDGRQLQRQLQGILNKLFNVDLKPEDRENRVVVHTLRHTFASHLAINGTPIQTIMKLMDHKKIEMTLRYAKLMPDSGRSDVENLYG